MNLSVDLNNEEVRLPSGEAIPFSVDPFRRQCLLKGLDDIGITLERVDAIAAFEDKHRGVQPWLFNEVVV